MCVVGRLVGISKDNIMEICATNSLNELCKDKIKAKLSENLAKNVKQYCSVGTLIGVRGKIVKNNDNFDINAERISFLTNRERE